MVRSEKKGTISADEQRLIELNELYDRMLADFDKGHRTLKYLKKDMVNIRNEIKKLEDARR